MIDLHWIEPDLAYSRTDYFEMGELQYCFTGHGYKLTGTKRYTLQLHVSTSYDSEWDEDIELCVFTKHFDTKEDAFAHASIMANRLNKVYSE